MENLFKIIRTLLILLVFISVNSKCYTQEQNINERVNLRIKELNNELNLNDKQEEQIGKIYTDLMEGMAQRRGNRTAPRGGGFDGGFAGGFGRFGQIDSDIEAVLTNEQVKKYRAFNLKQQVDARMSNLDETLSLNDEQKAKIRKIVEHDIQKTNEIFAEMRESEADRQTIFDKLRDQREDTNKVIEAVLTSEQIEKYRSSMSMGRRRM